MNNNYIDAIEWNVHGMAGYGNYYIPVRIIVDTILEMNKPKIIILTEFIKSTGYLDLKSALNCMGYEVFNTEYEPNTNGILIALDKTIFDIECEGMSLEDVEKKPNYFQINTTLKNINNEKFSIIGIRIKEGDIKEQLEVGMEYLKKINNRFICMGDFNAWDSYMEECLNDKVMYKQKQKWKMKHKDFKSLTEWSYVFQNGNKAPLDHIICKDINLVTYDYIWSFVKNKNGYGYRRPEDYKSDLIGIPDHAILYAEFSIKDNCKK